MTDADSDADAAAGAFEVLSDPSRVAILRELTDQTHSRDDSSVAFAELRRAVGVTDAGRFNYHLGKLQDRFAVKRDGGYAPTYAGMKAIGSIEAGTYTSDPSSREGTIDHDCPRCGDPLFAQYEDHLVTIECGDHGVFLQTAVPPSAASDATIAEIVAFGHRDLRRDLVRAVNGTCPVCAGAMAATSFERDDANRLVTDIDCQNCWMTIETPVGLVALGHPAVVSLYHDHGVDVRSVFPVNLDFVKSKENVEFVSENPVEIELVVEADDDTVTLRLDDALDVREV